ncbi:organic solute transporter subunit alpha-like isoform X2 [Limulus polyphemus]|uniref:Organic solute transporter subunit alpha-like isoform X2 n=1 Tax=Limulus polyphemus TaxID=6850 RepID=A0ABM1T5N0_LIMPO|nr:organic solute transporter subunit alpha-like isoform X2 [Limulus polyphemus]
MKVSTMNCSELLHLNYIPTVWEVFDALGNIGIFLVSVTGIATVLVFAIFFQESIYLFHHWPRQQCFLTLLCLNTFPFAAGGFFISMVFPNLAETAKTIILIYLPVSLVVYFRLMINYGGGEKVILRKLFGQEMILQGPPLCCLCFCCDKPPLTRRRFFFLKCSVYQLALTPVLLATAKYIGIEYGIFIEGLLSPYNAAPYISVISTLSMMFGVYSLVIFSRIAAASIKDFQMTHKFAPLQANFLLIRLQVIIFGIVGRAEAFPCIYPVSSTMTGHCRYKFCSYYRRSFHLSCHSTCYFSSSSSILHVASAIINL